MTDPIVTLPPDHWIVRAFEKWCEERYETDGCGTREQMWAIFSAGAQCIPGNPERIAELERKIVDLQAEGLDRRLVAVEDKLESLTALVADHASTIMSMNREVRSARDIFKSALPTLSKDVEKLTTLVSEHHQATRSEMKAEWEAAISAMSGRVDRLEKRERLDLREQEREGAIDGTF